MEASDETGEIIPEDSEDIGTDQAADVILEMQDNAEEEASDECAEIVPEDSENSQPSTMRRGNRKRKRVSYYSEDL